MSDALGLTDERRAELARRFCRLLRQQIGYEGILRAVKLNRRETDEGICHSHDFCDANVVMQAAWVGTFGREPDLEDAAQTDFWDAAWGLAVAADLDANHVNSGGK